MRTNTIQRRRTPLDVPWVRDELDLACSDTDLTSRKARVQAFLHGFPLVPHKRLFKLIGSERRDGRPHG